MYHWKWEQLCAIMNYNAARIYCIPSPFLLFILTISWIYSDPRANFYSCHTIYIYIWCMMSPMRVQFFVSCTVCERLYFTYYSCFLYDPRQQPVSTLCWLGNPFITMANVVHISALEPALYRALISARSWIWWQLRVSRSLRDYLDSTFWAAIT